MREQVVRLEDEAGAGPQRADLAQQGWTLMIVTHEIAFAREVADQVLFLDGGVVAERGGPAVITDPQEERTRQFLRRITSTG